MEAADALRILLDADVSSRALVRLLTERGHDVVAGGLVEELKQLDDPILFAVAQEQRRLVLTHNSHDFPDILREWADAGRRHHGCIISTVPTNAFREMEQRLERWFRLYPTHDDWIDRTVFL
jgi:predicted nuclease of predicted toxin-antitoxin system